MSGKAQFKLMLAARANNSKMAGEKPNETETPTDRKNDSPAVKAMEYGKSKKLPPALRDAARRRLNKKSGNKNGNN